MRATGNLGMYLSTFVLHLDATFNGDLIAGLLQ